MIGNKTCIKCGEDKPAEAFPASRNQCYACRAAHAHEYRAARDAGALAEWQAASKNAKIASGKTCRECGLKNVDFVPKANICIACDRAVKRAYYRGNADKIKARASSYKSANRDKYNEYAARHRAANPGAESDAYRRRRAANPDAYRAREQESRMRRRVSINAYQRALRRAHPERERNKAMKLQAETLSVASRWNYEWAGWELELISDYSRSARQLAFQLGRTIYAVRQQRSLILRDPQSIQRAGLSASGIL